MGLDHMHKARSCKLWVNIPILPMAFLTFAEAKVVAPPILPRKCLAHTVQIIKGSPYGANMRDDSSHDENNKVGHKSIMMSHQMMQHFESCCNDSVNQ